MGKAKKQPDIEALFKALSDRTRLRLLNLMKDGEVCVCFFVEVLQTSQPKISRHLAYLRRAGIVATRREGKWMHYRLVIPSDPHSAAVLNDVLAWLSQDKEMTRDSKRLVQVCCASPLPVQLQAAPKPPVALGSVAGSVSSASIAKLDRASVTE